MNNLVDARLCRRIDIAEGTVAHVVEHDGRAEVGPLVAEGDVVDMQALNVAGIETVGGRPAGKLRLGVVGALLAVVLVDEVARASALEVEADVGEPDVANGLVLHARDDDGAERVAVVGNEVRDLDVAGRREARHLLGAPVAATRGDVDGVMVDVRHRDVRHDDVLHTPLIDLLEGEAGRIGEGAVGERDVAIAAIRLSTQFEATTHPPYRLWHVSAIEQRATLIARDVAVRDGDVLSNDRPRQGIARLQDQRIVRRCVDLAIGDGHILAAVDVEAVAVGVDGDVVDGRQVAARHDDGEMAAAVDGDVADGDLSAEFQGYGLVAGTDAAALHLAGLLGVLLRQAFAVNHSVAGNRDVRLPLGPDERVVEVGMAAVLVLGEVERLRFVVELKPPFRPPRRGKLLRVDGEDGGTGGKVEVDVRLQADAAAEVGACRQQHLSATIFHSLFNSGVDGRRVKGSPVALGAEVADVVNTVGRNGERCGQGQENECASFHLFFWQTED